MEALDYRSQAYDDDGQDVLHPDFATDYPQWMLDNHIEKGYDKLVEPFVKKLGKEEVKNIDQEFDRSYKDGCLKTIELLSGILGLNQRQVVYENQPGNINLEYIANTVKIPVQKEGEFTEKDRLDTFETIAYEMWHARQHDIAKTGDDDRSDMYRDGLKAPAIMDMDEAHQPMELEARAFAENARDKFFAVSLANAWRHYEKMKGVVTRCSADIEELRYNSPTNEIQRQINVLNSKSTICLKEQMRAGDKIKELGKMTEDFNRYKSKQQAELRKQA